MTRRAHDATWVAILAVAIFAAVACGQSVFSLEMGDCFNSSAEDEVGHVEAIPCSEPHDSEVFAVTGYPEGDDDSYPGENSLKDYSETYCVDEFSGYVGISLWDSRLDISFLYPTRNSWTTADDREIVCHLRDSEGEKLNRSMQGSQE